MTVAREQLQEILTRAPMAICKMLSDTQLRSGGNTGYVIGSAWDALRRNTFGGETVVCCDTLPDDSLVQAMMDGICVAVHTIHASAVLLRLRCPEAVAQSIRTAVEAAALSIPVTLELGETVQPYAPLKNCNADLALIHGAEGFAWVCPALLGEELPAAKKPLRLFHLKGDVNRQTDVLLSDTITLREVLYGMGGGMQANRGCKAVQIGGPSSGCLTGDELDITLDNKSLKAHGLRRGNSTITVLDDQRCMVDATYRFMQHTQTEFCGKCVPCREGTRRMTELLARVVEQQANEEDFEMLLDLSDTVTVTAFCPLGKGAGSMLESARRAFPADFRAHLEDHVCPLCDGRDKRLGIYPEQTEYSYRYIAIDPSLCRGCTRCTKSCHAEAITGELKKPHRIDSSKCVKCYSCIETCAFGAIQEVERHG